MKKALAVALAGTSVAFASFVACGSADGLLLVHDSHYDVEWNTSGAGAAVNAAEPNHRNPLGPP